MSNAGSFNTGAGSVTTIDTDSGTATPIAGVINVFGVETVTTSATGNTVTIGPSVSGYPTTPYVVGPVGFAGYQTIQSALDAANAAGGGNVAVQASTTAYTEDLILYDNVSISGVAGDSSLPNLGNTVTIIGSHTPPNSGFFSINNCYLQHATSIFFSTNGGNATIEVSNCITDVANGFTWDMDAWGAPGGFVGFNNNGVPGSNNGVINNTAQAIVYLQDSVIGTGTGSMLTSGPITMKNVDLGIPWEMRKNTIQNIENCRFLGTVNATVNATGTFNYCRFVTGATPSFLMNSTDPINMRHCTFSSTAVPNIQGTGGGMLELGAALFNGDTTIAGTVNVSGTDGFLPASFGIAGEIFTSNGPGIIPSFQAGAGGTVTSVSGTANRITSTGGTTPVIDIAATYVGQTSLTTLGTIGTGTWQGAVIAGQYGGTGVANTGKTINLGSPTTGFVLTSDGSGNGTWKGLPANLCSFAAFADTNQTVGATSASVVTFGTEIFDNGSVFATSAFTVPTSAKQYRVHTMLTVISGSVTDKITIIRNGSPLFEGTIGGVIGVQQTIDVDGMFTLTAGDSIQVAYTNNGAVGATIVGQAGPSTTPVVSLFEGMQITT